MTDEVVLKPHHPSGFACFFLVSFSEDFEGVVCTTAVVDSVDHVKCLRGSCNITPNNTDMCILHL